MTPHIKASSLASSLRITERHARRLIQNNDPRVTGPDRDWLLRCSRRRIAAECRSQAESIYSIAGALDRAPNTETFREGPEIDRLGAIVKRLRRMASDLRTLGGDIEPEA
jgi:hypothetical protein